MMNASLIMEGFVPDVDATVVSRILDAGGHIVGKAVCENLCVSGGSFTAATGLTVNPHNKTRMAGGSSSGSAALVREARYNKSYTARLILTAVKERRKHSEKICIAIADFRVGKQAFLESHNNEMRNTL